MSKAAHIFLLLKDCNQQPATEGGQPSISGEATADGFAGHVVVDKFDWDAGREEGERSGFSGPEGVASNVTSPGIELGYLKFDKRMDVSSCDLLNAMSSGRELNAVLSIVEPMAGGFSMKVLLSRVLVTNYTLDLNSGEAGSGEATESWTFSYEEIKLIVGEDKSTVSVDFKRKPGQPLSQPSVNDVEEKLIQIMGLVKDEASFNRLVESARRTAKKRADDALQESLYQQEAEGDPRPGSKKK